MSEKRMSYKEKFEAAKQKGIYIPEKLLADKNIVGVYEIFAKNDKGEKICLYVGRTTNAKQRLLAGHIHEFLKGNFEQLVPKLIQDFLNIGCTIGIKIIEVDYRSTNFAIAATKLAQLEINEIAKFQANGQCLNQVPEGTGQGKRFWEENYKKDC